MSEGEKKIIMRPRKPVSMDVASSDVGKEIDATELQPNRIYLIRYREEGEPRADFIGQTLHVRADIQFMLLFARTPRRSDSSEYNKWENYKIMWKIYFERIQEALPEKPVRFFEFGPEVEGYLMSGMSPQKICKKINDEEITALFACSTWRSREGNGLNVDLIRRIMDFVGHTGKGIRRGGKKSFKRNHKRNNKTRKYRK